MRGSGFLACRHVNAVYIRHDFSHFGQAIVHILIILDQRIETTEYRNRPVLGQQRRPWLVEPYSGKASWLVRCTKPWSMLEIVPQPASSNVPDKHRWIQVPDVALPCLHKSRGELSRLLHCLQCSSIQQSTYIFMLLPSNITCAAQFVSESVFIDPESTFEPSECSRDSPASSRRFTSAFHLGTRCIRIKG